MNKLPVEHAVALERADEADRILAQGDVDSAIAVFAQAAELEERALSKIPQQKTRTIGVLGISATALWYEAAEYKRAIALAEKLLGIGSLDPQHHAALEDILAAIPYTVASTGTGTPVYSSIAREHDDNRRARLKSQLGNILAEARRKDGELARLYEEHRTLLSYVAVHKFRVPLSAAEDLISEVFISFHRSEYRPENPRAWLVAAMCNACRHYWRAQGRFEALLDDFDVTFDPTSQLEARVTAERLLPLLREPCRQLLGMYYFDGLTTLEISTKLGVSVNAIHKRLQRCLASAREKYLALTRGRTTDS